MLQPVFADIRVRDFQDHPPWRTLVVETAAQILGYVGGTLVIPQSVLVRSYWAELTAGLAKAGVPVRHFVLHAETEVLARRIEQDTVEIRQWRLDHLADYAAALPWLREAGEVVETVGVTPDEVAARIAAAVTG
jgi:hypothetical protein